MPNIKNDDVILDLPARVMKNEMPLEGEGGRVVIHADDEEARKADFRQVETILNAATDAVMEPFPETRDGMRSERFRIMVVREAEE